MVNFEDVIEVSAGSARVALRLQVVGLEHFSGGALVLERALEHLRGGRVVVRNDWTAWLMCLGRRKGE